MSTLRKLSKTLLLISLKAIPGADVATRVFNDDVDQMLDCLIPNGEKQSQMQLFAEQIAKRISNRAHVLMENQGAALSAAEDFLWALSKANITFACLAKLDFDAQRLIGHLQQFRPQGAGNQRRQLWDEAIEDFSQGLLVNLLEVQRFQSELLILIYRQQKQLLNNQEI